MLLGVVGAALSLLAISHATTLLWLTLLWVALQVPLNVIQAPLTAALVSGMGFGTYMSLDLALMTEVLPKGSAAGKDLGLLNIATNVPQALGPIIASALITSFAVGADKTPGYRVLFGFAIAAVLISAVAVRPIKGVK